MGPPDELTKSDHPYDGGSLTLAGKDNHGRLRQEFADKIASMTDEAFVTEATQRIWLSAYANNNPRSDYHWQADACWDEAQRREKPKLYTRAYNAAYEQATGYPRPSPSS